MSTSTSGSVATVEPTKVDMKTFLGVIWGGFAIAVICMALRTFSRIKTFKSLYTDDIFAFLALALALASAILWQIHAQAMFDLMAVSAGIKMPGTDFVTNSEAYSKASGVVIILFYSTLWSVKFSFLLFIRRLGSHVAKVEFLWWPITVFTICTYFACIGTIQYNCLFVPLTTIETKCTTDSAVNFQQITLKLNCVWDVLSDALIMIIPISMLWGTQMKMKRKITFGIIFSLALITVIFAIVRTTVVSSLTRMPDTSWLYMWSAIETTIAIVVVCLASIRGLFSKEENVKPTKYTPPKSSEFYLKNSRKNRLRATLDTFTGRDSYMRTEDPKNNQSPTDGGSSVTSEQNILPLDNVRVKQRYEVTHELATTPERERTYYEHV
ncbi:hypothetical protein BCIN_09g06670 [Botrytis cinerea B05.10]|uniref:Rhodopsin domain-containing protein n=1 Tax=Botryotinia fuckeliana (strain B05.10) TaxID=332648 RepID=A0A384JTL1_BOTFB|nr:hypothetical protein BCIN_09g06670 [Botrytis cinerea B05.10]ATZ53909.1 hypothetical protein BCIN_09g06670 [Botrytis cinerea B05.10]